MGNSDQRFDVNLSILFTELPLIERPAAAAAAGFTAVELWWPWIETPTPAQAELDALKKALEEREFGEEDREVHIEALVRVTHHALLPYRGS